MNMRNGKTAEQQIAEEAANMKAAAKKAEKETKLKLQETISKGRANIALVEYDLSKEARDKAKHQHEIAKVVKLVQVLIKSGLTVNQAMGHLSSEEQELFAERDKKQNISLRTMLEDQKRKLGHRKDQASLKKLEDLDLQLNQLGIRE